MFVANFRGDGAYCYHQPCDDIEHYLTEDNVNFLGKTVDSIVQVIHKLSEPQASKSNGTFCSLPYSSRKHILVMCTPLQLTFEPVHEKTNNFDFRPTRSDTNRAVQSQKMVRGWKFRIYIKVEELYYPCSEYNGADQLRSDREADLSASLFSHLQIVGFPTRRLNIAKLGFTGVYLFLIQNIACEYSVDNLYPQSMF